MNSLNNLPHFMTESLRTVTSEDCKQDGNVVDMKSKNHVAKLKQSKKQFSEDSQRVISMRKQRDSALEKNDILPSEVYHVKKNLYLAILAKRHTKKVLKDRKERCRKSFAKVLKYVKLSSSDITANDPPRAEGVSADQAGSTGQPIDLAETDDDTVIVIDSDDTE